MLQAAGELADGAFLNFLPLAAAGTPLAEIRRGEETAGKRPGSTEVACRFFCVQGEPEQAFQIARWMFCAYATVPVYERFFRWLGYGEAIDPMIEAWRGGDRGAALEAAPRELVEDVFVIGDPDTQRARIEAYVDAGVTLPVLLIVPEGGPAAGVDVDSFGAAVEALAPR
jgi:alkanesulfonate monooxygenase SsuD/methylene tetrahydromethanopterin reductase-like flavin-dependent oxidoreductase (luciferase family)